MPHLSIRTRKIARLRVWLTVLAAVVACSGGSDKISGPSSPSQGTGPTLPPQVASVSVSASSANAALGTSVQFSAVAKDAGGNAITGQTVTWTSSDSTIVAISGAGLATYVGIGTVTITATTLGGITGTTTVTVTGGAPIASIAVTPPQVNVGTGQTTRFAAVMKDAAGNVLAGRRAVWLTSNATVMKVDSMGMGTPLGQGSVTITVQSAGVSANAVASVSGAPVQPPGTVADLTVIATTDTSATIQFTQVPDGQGGAAGYDIRAGVPPTNFVASPSVTRGSCATPVTGTGPTGTFTCTILGLTPATTYNVQLIAFRGTFNVNPVFGALSNVAVALTVPSRTAATIAVTPPAATTTIGQQVQLTANVLNAGGIPIPGSPVTWTTSSATIATVSPSGLVTAVTTGDAFITATSAGATSGSSHITVARAPRQAWSATSRCPE